jgi:outer membrane protein assembly factor BamB
VVILVAVIVAMVMTSGGGGKGSSARSSSSGTTKLNPWQARQAQYDAMGSVTYGNELVVTADTGVYAYNRENGNLVWTVRPPANGAKGDAFCGSGQRAVSGKLSVGFGEQTDLRHHILNCTSVGLVDLQSGKMLWTRQIPTAAQLKANPLSTDGMLTEISGNTVMATWNTVGTAFSAANGHRLWTEAYGYDFRDLAAANGRFYGLFALPAPFPGQAPMALDGISPASGIPVSRLHMTGRMTHTGTPTYGAIVATSPMTLLVSDASTSNDASYLVLDPTRKHITQVIPAGAQFPGSGRHVLDAMQVGGNSDSHPYIKSIVGGGMLITVSYPTGASQDKLLGYDLSTGAKRWSATQQGVKMIAPVAVDGNTVIAVGSTAAGLGNPTLVRVSLTSGKVLSSTPRPTGADRMQDAIDNYHFTWSDGRAYAVAWEQTPVVSDIPGLFTMSAP